MSASANPHIAATLLDLKAVVLSPENPFTWASGLASPIYCDNRLIMSSVSAREAVIEAFCQNIKAMTPQPQAIAGCATAGIPHAAWIADRLKLPMVYVRSSEKKHGRQNRIEGRLSEGTRVLVIEDLISTGGSAIKVAQCLQEAGCEILQITSVFQYGLPKAAANFAAAGMAFQSLTDLETLLKVAVEKAYLNQAEFGLLQAWRQDPKAWSDAHGKG